MERAQTGNRFSMDHVPPQLANAIDVIESRDALDRIADRLTPLAGALANSPLKGWLRGEKIGHAAHPMLTDIPIGCFTSAAVLDLVGGRRGASGAQRLIGLGLLSLPATAATGLVDWNEASADPRIRRAGVVHALGNTVAGTLYLASWQHRRRGHRGRGVLLGMAGMVVASGAGYLGGHLAQARGAGQGERGMSSRAPSHVPSDWADQSGSEPVEDLIDQAPIQR